MALNSGDALCDARHVESGLADDAVGGRGDAVASVLSPLCSGEPMYVSRTVRHLPPCRN